MNPGIMPVYTIKLTNMLAKACGTTLTDELLRRLDELSAADKNAVLNYGIDYALQQCRDLLKQGVDGLHFYTMDRSKSTKEIIAGLRREKLL